MEKNKVRNRNRNRSKVLEFMTRGFFLVTCFGFVTEIFSADMLAIVIAKSGDVVYEKGNKDSSLVTKGQILEKNHRIITKNGIVDLQIGVNSIIRIGKHSNALLSKLIEESGSQKVELNLNKGALFVKTTSKLTKKSEFKVISPTIAAGVRGTQFLIQEGEDSDSKDKKIEPGVYVKEGAVDIKTDYSKDSIVIEAGKGIITSQKNLEAQLLGDFVIEKMKILDTLNVMKETNYKDFQMQRQKNKELLKK